MGVLLHNLEMLTANDPASVGAPRVTVPNPIPSKESAVNDRSNTTKDPAEQRAKEFFDMAQAYEVALIDIDRIMGLARTEIVQNALVESGFFRIPQVCVENAVALISAARSHAKNAGRDC